MSLMFACQRQQILLLTTGNQEAASMKINLTLNFIILIFPLIIAILYPKAGSLAGTLGAIGGLLCIYILPTVTYLSQT